MSQSTHQTPTELWYTRCGAATASGLAIRKQWLQQEFAKPGTQLRSLKEADSLTIRNSHYNHTQTGMFREGGNIPPIWAKAGGADTVVLGITWLDEYQGILVGANSDIRTVADLRGKRLAVPLHQDALIDFQRGAAQHGYQNALSTAGLSVSDVRLIDVKATGRERQGEPDLQREAVLQALDKGEVDAVFIRFARGYRASRDIKYRQIINLNDLSDPLLRVGNGVPRPITVDRAFLNQHPDLVVRYLAVLLRTAQWATWNRAEVADLLLPESGGDTHDDVFAAHGVNVHRAFTPKLSPEYILGLETQKNFLRDWGYLAADFSVTDWIVTEPLAQAQSLVAQEAQAAITPLAA